MPHFIAAAAAAACCSRDASFFVFEVSGTNVVSLLLLDMMGASLANGDWVSIQSVIAEKHFWEIIGKLKALGAEGILVLPIEKMIL